MMFGMLDYRAHKLLWLLALPIRVLGRIFYFINLALAIIVAEQTTYSLLIKIVIAYAVFEAAGIVVLIVLRIMGWALTKAFFWTVDVVPARGTNSEEAREIVLNGPIIWLSNKLTGEIENWTDEDTAAFAAATTNWRGRMFFKARDRLEKRIGILVDFHERTGQQPAVLSIEETNKLVRDLNPTWLEKAIVTPWTFNALLGLTIIAFTVIYLS